MVRIAVYKNGGFHTIAGQPVPPTHGRFRGSHNTGLPAGTVLGAAENGLTVTTPGTVLEDRLFYGSVAVEAPDVTIRRCKFVLRFGGSYAIDATGVPASQVGATYSLEVQDCEVDGSDLGAAASLYIGSYTAVRRCYIIGAADTVKIGGANCLLEDSWLHEQTQYPGGHDDALQTTSGDAMIIRRNRLEVMNVEFDTMYNSCFQVGSLSGDLTNLTFEDNYLNGGNYMVNGTGDSENGHLMANTVWRRNRFGPDYRNGQARGDVVNGAAVDWDDTNVDDITGLPV